MTALVVLLPVVFVLVMVAALTSGSASCRLCLDGASVLMVLVL
jgi:hypothetical protein